MYLAYYDESGDDGYPRYSTEIFVLSCLYMHHDKWKDNYAKIVKFRRQLKVDYDFPIKEEFHCRQFLLDKSPYHGKYSMVERKEIYLLFIDLISILDISIINVVIDKTKIPPASTSYDVLENAFTYSIQRIENTLERISPNSKFMLLCDKGRVGKMRKTSRRIQRINFIPSKLYPGTSYRKEIEGLIEDPIEKDSKESYFIQIADIIAFSTFIYSHRHIMNPARDWANRLKRVLNYGDETVILDKLLPVLNTKASRSNKYGIVNYPK